MVYEYILLLGFILMTAIALTSVWALKTTIKSWHETHNQWSKLFSDMNDGWAKEMNQQNEKWHNVLKGHLQELRRIVTNDITKRN